MSVHHTPNYTARWNRYQKKLRHFHDCPGVSFCHLFENWTKLNRKQKEKVGLPVPERPALPGPVVKGTQDLQTLQFGSRVIGVHRIPVDAWSPKLEKDFKKLGNCKVILY
jgi:hypothetical protein